jgi:hypothetical protein
MKYLQIAEKSKSSGSAAGLFVKGVSTAGSRKGLFQCLLGGVLHTVCGVGVDGEGHPVIVGKPKPEALRTTTIAPHL